MTVQTQDGRLYEITVPAGSKPGQQLLVTVPEYTQSFQAATGEEMNREPLSNECVVSPGRRARRALGIPRLPIHLIHPLIKRHGSTSKLTAV